MTAMRPATLAPTDLHAAMVALRQRQITPDEFRAVMHTSRELNGDVEHDDLKAQATAALGLSR
jgi:hypothetical protein